MWRCWHAVLSQWPCDCCKKKMFSVALKMKKAFQLPSLGRLASYHSDHGVYGYSPAAWRNAQRIETCKLLLKLVSLFIYLNYLKPVRDLAALWEVLGDKWKSRFLHKLCNPCLSLSCLSHVILLKLYQAMMIWWSLTHWLQPSIHPYIPCIQEITSLTLLADITYCSLR